MTNSFGTGTSSKKRSGVGTIMRYRHNEGVTYVALERANKSRVLLALTPDLARKLLDEFGYRQRPDFISVEPLIGMKVAYRENATGTLTDIQPFRN